MRVKPKRKTLKQLQAECDRFNAKFPVGSEVFVKLDGVEEPFRTVTKSNAQVLGAHSAVIWLENVSGAYLLDRVSGRVEEIAE